MRDTRGGSENGRVAYYYMKGHAPTPMAARIQRREVRSGSKNGSVWARAARPFYPQEQTSSACPGMSVWCQQRTHAPQRLRGGDAHC